MKKEPQDQTKSRPKRKAPKSAWKPGQSGNPGGKPKGTTSFKALMLRIGLEPSTKNPEITRDEAITKEIYKQAEAGDKLAIKFVVEHREGKPNQQIDITEREHDEVVVIG